MPNYLYRCRCKKITEKEFRFAQNPDKILCECGKWARRYIQIKSLSYQGFITSNKG